MRASPARDSRMPAHADALTLLPRRLRACPARQIWKPVQYPNEFEVGRLLNIVTPLHKMTKRDYVGRMMDDKVHCMLKAKEYEADYWDGDRRYGYGGYRYIEGRWKPVAQALIDLLRS